MNCSLTKMY